MLTVFAASVDVVGINDSNDGGVDDVVAVVVMDVVDPFE